MKLANFFHNCYNRGGVLFVPFLFYFGFFLSSFLSSFLSFFFFFFLEFLTALKIVLSCLQGLPNIKWLL